MRAHNVRERYRSLKNWGPSADVHSPSTSARGRLIPVGADNHGAAALRNFLHGTQFAGLRR